jgi:hypothetical protein
MRFRKRDEHLYIVDVVLIRESRVDMYICGTVSRRQGEHVSSWQAQGPEKPRFGRLVSLFRASFVVL